MATGRVNRVHEILLKSGLIDATQLKSTLGHQEQFGGRLVSLVAELGFADEEAAAQALAKGLNLPMMSLGTVLTDARALAKVSPEQCERDVVFPVSMKDRVLTLAMVDPTDLKTVDDIAVSAQTRVTTVVATESQIRAAIAKHYHNETVAPKTPSRQRQAVTGPPPPAPAAFEFEFQERPNPNVNESRGLGANTMLDEMFDTSALDWPADAQDRLEGVQLTQRKIAGIMQALQSLLTEKGYR